MEEQEATLNRKMLPFNAPRLSFHCGCVLIAKANPTGSVFAVSFMTMTRDPRKQLEREGLFWLLFSEVSGQLATLFLGPWDSRTPWQKGMAEWSFSSRVIQRAENDRKRKNIAPKNMFSMACFPPSGPTSYISLTYE